MKRSTKLLLFSTMLLAVLLPMSAIQVEAAAPYYWYDQFTMNYHPPPYDWDGTYNPTTGEAKADSSGSILQMRTKSTKVTGIALNVRVKMLMKAGTEDDIKVSIYSSSTWPAGPSSGRLEYSGWVHLQSAWYYRYFYIGTDCANRYVTVVFDQDQSAYWTFYYKLPVLQVQLTNVLPD